jgi:hypothetical protein
VAPGGETLLLLVAGVAAAPDMRRSGSRPLGTGEGWTQGSSIGADPLTAVYRSRVDALEAQLVQLADVDVEGTVGAFYAGEVAALEGKVVDLTTKLLLRSRTS